MSDQNHIIIQGLCQNNLKNISLKIPKQKLVVFTGVSGSGKSSIVFDTIAAESVSKLLYIFSSRVFFLFSPLFSFLMFSFIITLLTDSGKP